MRCMINGREFDIPTGGDGQVAVDDVRRAAAIPPDRPLMLKKDNGANTVMKPGQRISVSPWQHFADMPAYRRGH